MAQSVSQKFLNAQASDANLVVSEVQLVLGNYFSNAAYGSTVVSSGDSSTDYPAIGAIDGDRTEINVGATSGADNDIGKSSWRSSGIPDNGDTVTLTITMTQSRTLNRIKLYHLSSHGLKSYKIEYWNGSSFVQFAATSDIGGAGTLFATTGTLDTIDFSDLSTTIVKLTITHTQVASDNANVVEIEAYRLIDISDRVKKVGVSRQRDYKLSNPMASTVQIDCINTDRYFSVNHVPSTAEATAGFVNQELQPGVGLLVMMGFNYYGASSELVTTFTGEIDSVSIKPMTRDAVISGRDIMKRFINKIDSCKLKTGKDIATNIQYVLNRGNVSNYEMALDTTGINIDYFFTEQQSQLDTIRDLSQAAGDTLFYVDELGIPTFRDYNGIIPNDHIYTSQIDWDSGTMENISDIGAYSGMIAVPPQFVPVLADGTLAGQMIISGGNLTLVSSTAFNGDSYALGGGTMQTVENNAGSHPVSAIYHPYSIPRSGTIDTLTIGGWQLSSGSHIVVEVMQDFGGIPFQDGGVLYTSAVFSGNQNSPVTVTPGLHVTPGTYWVAITSYGQTIPGFITKAQTQATPGNIPLARTLNGPYFYLNVISGGFNVNAGLCSGFTFTYDVVAASGDFTSVWYDSGSAHVSLTPSIGATATYSAGNAETSYLDGSDDGSAVAVTYSVNNLNGTSVLAVVQHRYWRLRVSASATDDVHPPIIGSLFLLFGPSGTWTSPILDTGASTVSFGSITATTVLNGGTIAYYTASSADGIGFDPYIAVSGSGNILSAVQRYLKTKVIITLGPGTSTPLILDLTVNWSSGSGSPKYPSPSSFTFSFDSSLLDVSQELADNLGGDTSILNDIIVQAEPLVLTGTDSDTVWQGTIGTPPSNISGSTPLTVVAGNTVTIAPIISGGMDITNMSGANPAAAAITFGTATGSWVFSSIHPTLPVLVITITGSGTITDLRIIGKTFQNASYLQAQESSDATSIAKYGDRQLSISNQFITSTALADIIASSLLSNFKDPTSYIPSAKVQFCPSLQLGDRVTVDDINLDLTADYIVIGEGHTMDVSMQGADVSTDLVLLKIPVGL